MGAIVPDVVPVDEEIVRRTAVPVSDEMPPAELPSVPDWNQIDTDPNPDLGMVNRALASHIIPSEKYSPFWKALADDNHNYSDRIDSTIGTVGLAPSREAAGQFGHGTMQIQIAIDPVQDLSGAGGMTNEYFVREPRPIQETMPASMQPPPGMDYTTPGLVGQNAKTAGQTAAESAMYPLFYRAVAGT
jgi:hypothetical protein